MITNTPGISKETLHNLLAEMEPVGLGTGGQMLCIEQKTSLERLIHTPENAKQHRAFMYKVLKVADDVKDIFPGDLLIAEKGGHAPFYEIEVTLIFVKREWVHGRIPRDAAERIIGHARTAQLPAASA